MNEPDQATTGAPAPEPIPLAHADFISSQLPAWATQAGHTIRQALRSSLINSNQSRHDLKALLDEVQSPQAFCQPLLDQALRQTFLGALDDKKHMFVRDLKNSHLLGLIKTHVGVSMHSLLEAAMQNFQPDEAEEGGFETGTGLYPKTTPLKAPLNLSATRFARMCRSLDLGSQYQRHLNELFDPLLGSQARRTQDQVTKLFAQKEKDAFECAAHIALLRDKLTSSIYQSLLDLHREGRHSSLLCSHLTINGVALPSVLVINDRHVAHHVLLYTPNDPFALFRQHASMAELESELAKRLRNPRYLALFNRLVPHRYQGTLFTVSGTTLDILPGKYSGGVIAPHIDQLVARTDIQCDVFEAIAQQQINQIKSYAKSLVVSTGETDRRAREQRLEHYREIGKTLLFFAASFIPVVGEVLLAVTGAQLISAVYHGIEAWSRGDSNEALNCLMDVVDNVALAVVTAGAVKTAGFTAGLVRVKMANKNTRLWNPDLTPYRHLKELPEQAIADDQGVYLHDQQHYVKMDDHLHAVNRDPKTGLWQLVHPYTEDAYMPTLLTNGKGSWRLEHENPQGWDLLKLLKRLVPEASNITRPSVASILHIADEDGATLVQLHQEVLRPPPLLRDVIKRFNLDAKINTFKLNHADGTQQTSHSPLIQFYLTASLPEWPKDRVLQVMDSQNKTVLAHGSSGAALKVPLARFAKGQLLHTLAEQLPSDALDSLVTPIEVPPDALPYFSDIDKLAIRLTDELNANKHQLLTSLYKHSEAPTSSMDLHLRNLRPELSQSHREELLAVLSDKEVEEQLVHNKPLDDLQRWEADRYAQQLRTSRIKEGIHLDSASTPESVTSILSLLERLPGWPAPHRMEIRQGFSSGTLQSGAGQMPEAGRYILAPEGELFVPHYSTGEPMGDATDLYKAIELTLTPTQRSTLFEATHSRSLKQAVREFSLQDMDSNRLPTRLLRPKVIPASSAGHPIDPLFADPAPAKGLTLRTDGIYEGPTQADGFSRHYLFEGERFYRIRSDKWGWQLIDARSPSRAYKPYVRKSAQGTWEIDPQKGKLLGGMPDSPLIRRAATAGESQPPASPTGGLESTDDELESMVSTDDEFESALSSDEYTSADESYSPEPFSFMELMKMRSQENYQHSQNYRRIYNRYNNGRYPIRDIDGQPLRIRFMQAIGKSLTSDIRIPKSKITPYIQWQGYEKVARLYEEKMEVTTFTAAHQKFPQESALTGEKTVIARRTLQKHEVLGLYGGELLPRVVATYRQDPYLLSVDPHNMPKPGERAPTAITNDVLLSGDNITSRINTIFEYEEDYPVRQAASGYNVEAVPFDMDVQKGTLPMQRLQLTALVANDVIPAGTELRWNYQYSEPVIRKLFGPPPS